MIYLDNAATTPIDPEVLEVMLPFLRESYGNAGSVHALGRKSKEAIEGARQQVADFVGCSPEHIIFTSGGTEANNMALLGVKDYLAQNNKKHIIASAAEHDSVLKPLKKMCIKDGFGLSFLGVNQQGTISPMELKDLITDCVGLVSVMYVNNETGAENPIDVIGDICAKRDVLFHTDCVQAAGSNKLDASEIGCDFLTISSHKIHGPKGAGALYVKDTSLVTPTVFGGVTQEFGLRGGTENVAAIVGFGKACEIMNRQLHDNDVHTSVLKQLFFTNIRRELVEHNLEDILHINGDSVIKHGKVLNMRFDGVDGETLLFILDSKGVCVSAGSACRSNESEPSHVLTAMGLDKEDARNSIRLSFSKMNTEDEVVAAARIVSESVIELKK